MRTLIVIVGFCLLASAQELSEVNRVRIAEFYRLSAQTQEEIWPGWSKSPAPLLLVTPATEFLTRHPAPPKDFVKISEGNYARPRQFSKNLLATFPAFGPPSVIVIGEPENTEAKTSTPWLMVLMHERFHQLQNGQPGYFDKVNALDLSRGDTSGMWMLNYDFPYEKPEVASGFIRLRDRLLAAIAERDERRFKKLAKEYARARRQWFASVSEDEGKYFEFQLWQEGVARYIQIRSAEAAGRFPASDSFKALPDYEPFTAVAARARKETLDELKQVDLVKWKRISIYSFGAAEALLLDRWKPGWKQEYLVHPLSMERHFRRTN